MFNLKQFKHTLCLMVISAIFWFTKRRLKYKQDGDEGDNEEGGREIKMSITKVC